MRNIVCILAFCTLPAFAQEVADSLYSSEIELTEVVVTGTRVPRLLKDTPVQTRVISSKEIERADAGDIRDLLGQLMPGVEFSYSMNQQTHMNFGGFGGQSLLFLVDGERLAGETLDDVDFSRIDMANVERIEIVRGASSALYGSNAGGGVINIITREASNELSGDLQFRSSSHADRRYTASLNNRFGRFANTLSLSASRISSYDVKNGADPEGRVISTIYGHRSLNIRERLQWRPADALTLSARAGFYMRELPREVDAPERYRSYSGGLKGEWNITASDRLELSYSFDQYDKSQYHRLSGREIRKYSNVQNSLRALYSHYFSESDILTVGADFMRDWLLNEKLKDGSMEQNNLNLFVQYDWRISPQWEVVGTARYDWFRKGTNRM